MLEVTKGQTDAYPAHVADYGAPTFGCQRLEPREPTGGRVPTRLGSCRHGACGLARSLRDKRQHQRPENGTAQEISLRGVNNGQAFNPSPRETVVERTSASAEHAPVVARPRG
jgi:hypothetical protein